MTDQPRVSEQHGRPSGTSRPAPVLVHELGRADGPTLVLLHGLSDSGLCWPDAVRRWRHDYRVIAPDARGHGESPRFDPATAGSNRFDDMVADVVSLLEAVRSDGHCAGSPLLIGHSMGAGIAGAVLATRPDLVVAAVLEDPPWLTTPDGGDRPLGREPLQQSVQSFRDDLEAALARGRSELPLWPEIELGPWAESKAQLDPSLTDREQIVRQAPWIENAVAITRPTLVLTGGRDECVLVSARSRQRLAHLGNRQIEVQVVLAAGHTVRRDDPDAYHRIVDPWIRRHFDDAGSAVTSRQRAIRTPTKGDIMAGFVATAETEIHASPAQVWVALTDPKLIKLYMFGSQVETDWQQGSPIVWKGEYEGRTYEDKGTILEIETERHLKVTHFSPLSGLEDVPENYHTLVYELAASGDTTYVSLSQDKNASEAEAEHSKGMWGMMLAGLKKVVEGG